MKNKNLIWVYPSNNWVSHFNKTFIYGSCNPIAKLYVSINQGKEERVKVLPNGNFAQTIKLSNKKNTITLIQLLGNKKKSISRVVKVKRHKAEMQLIESQHKNSKFKIKNTKQEAQVIIIDPGHGGKEHGTHSPKGIPEKVYNLEIAKLLFKTLRREWLRPFPTQCLYLTRSADKFVSLKQRVNFAKKKKCNLFISIHHNALPDNENPLKHKGLGIYYAHDFVKPFAKKLLESISKETGLKKYGIFKRDFAVTRPDFYTGVLIECGFLIHPEEGEYVIKKTTQEKIVRGIIKSL